MNKRSFYISVLFLALLISVLANKLVHDIGCLTHRHCDIETIHFCQPEHSCELCKHVIVKSVEPPEHINLVKAPKLFTEYYFSYKTSIGIISTEYPLSLRGPPEELL